MPPTSIEFIIGDPTSKCSLQGTLVRNKERLSLQRLGRRSLDALHTTKQHEGSMQLYSLAQVRIFVIIEYDCKSP